MSAWGEYANVVEHQRYMVPVQQSSRRRCFCGCKARGTHHGAANGMVMTAPACELTVRRWVKTHALPRTKPETPNG